MAVFRIDGYGSGCACSRDKCSDDCATYRNYKPKSTTNADRIRAMTDEELAEWMAQVEWMAQFERCVEHKRKCDSKCHLCWIEWLKQEAEND